MRDDRSFKVSAARSFSSPLYETAQRMRQLRQSAKFGVRTGKARLAALDIVDECADYKKTISLSGEEDPSSDVSLWSAASFLLAPHRLAEIPGPVV